MYFVKSYICKNVWMFFYNKGKVNFLFRVHNKHTHIYIFIVIYKDSLLVTVSYLLNVRAHVAQLCQVIATFFIKNFLTTKNSHDTNEYILKWKVSHFRQIISKRFKIFVLQPKREIVWKYHTFDKYFLKDLNCAFFKLKVK